MQAARDHGISWPIVAAAFTTHATAVLPAEPEPVAVLGIDEVRRGKPRWIGDEQAASWTRTAHRWHVGFCDLSGGQGLLAQVEGRTTAAATGWLAARPPTWREQIRAVAIDMCTVFKATIPQVLPHALLVVDHFHVVQLANRAVTEVRRRVTLTQRGRRGRSSNPEWRMRNRLTRSAARMPGTHVDRLTDTLDALPANDRHPDPRRVERERRPARPARDRPHPPGPPTRPPTAAPLLHPLRRHRPARTPPTRYHHRDLVATDPRVPDPPASPTPAPEEPTGSSRPSPATPTASETPKTSAHAPAPPPPDATTGTSTPLNFEEPPC